LATNKKEKGPSQGLFLEFTGERSPVKGHQCGMMVVAVLPGAAVNAIAAAKARRRAP
jgi:hypothetical protein